MCRDSGILDSDELPKVNPRTYWVARSIGPKAQTSEFRPSVVLQTPTYPITVESSYLFPGSRVLGHCFFFSITNPESSASRIMTGLPFPKLPCAFDVHWEKT